MYSAKKNSSQIGHLILIFVILLLLYSLPVCAEESFELHLLDVGQGQCTLIKNNGHALLIDGGGRSASSFVVSYLKQQEIDTLDCIIVSHYDEDHMAGLIGVLSVFRIGTLMVPSYAGEGDLYNSFAASALSNGCVIIHPKVGTSFQMGNSTIEIVGPINPTNAEENNNSLCIRVIYNNSKILICGDAEQQSEYDMVTSGEDISANIYVVSHHGSSSSSSDLFLDKVSPEYALISCGRNNKYGHPTVETLNRLKSRNIDMFRTDLQGTIIAYTNGDDFRFNMEPSSDWTPGSDPGEDVGLRQLFVNDVDDPETYEHTQVDDNVRYVCNKKTMKFHYPDCQSVYQMNEENRLFTDLERDDLISQGYNPCGSCKP